MDQDIKPTNNQLSNPGLEVEPSSLSDQPHQPTIESPVLQPKLVKSGNSSDATTYLVGVFSGLFILCDASYLAGRVLYQLIVERSSSFLFFDFSSFDLYVAISLMVFALVYFLSMRRTEKAVDSEQAENNMLQTIRTIWQAILVIVLLGAIVSLIYSPISASIGISEAPNKGATLAYEALSSLFVIVFSGMLFLREWLRVRFRSTLLPTVVIIVLCASVIIGAMAFILQPKQAQDEIDYSQSGALEDYEGNTGHSALAELNAEAVAKKAEAYNAINGSYPKTIADFATTEESKLDDSTYQVISESPAGLKEIQYKSCSKTGAQISYYEESTSSVEIIAVGSASSISAC
jgi:hypothetical protein